jgi:hypothetical protein
VVQAGRQGAPGARRRRLPDRRVAQHAAAQMCARFPSLQHECKVQRGATQVRALGRELAHGGGAAGMQLGAAHRCNLAGGFGKRLGAPHNWVWRGPNARVGGEPPTNPSRNSTHQVKCRLELGFREGVGPGCRPAGGDARR